METNDALFSRERLAGYEPERMARSVALVVGAGALGQNTTLNLALSGVGEIRIVDKDEFEPHNRTRSPAYPLPEERDEIGLGKARAVARKLGRLMTAPAPVMRYAHKWIQELGDGAFKEVSVVVSCVDNPSARAYLSDKARLHGIALVEGGFEAAEITLSSYPAARGEAAQTTPCWRCSHPETVGAFSCDFYAERVEQAGFIPAIQNAAATLGGLQAEAAIAALHAQMSEPTAARAFDLNIRTGSARVVNLSTDPACPGLHRSLDEPPRRLTTTNEDRVEMLVREIAAHSQADPILLLEFPFIRSAACRECQQMTVVDSPGWAWAMSPRCRECGGEFPRAAAGMSEAPVVESRLTLNSDPELLNLSCGQLGLCPLSLVEALTAPDTSSFFELAGSLEHLFTSGDTHEQRQD